MLNIPLCAALIGWFFAQFIKILIALWHEKRFNLALLWSSGGMPSSHSALVTALASSIAYTHGIGSVAFAVSAILAFIVMYDAAGVRRAVGEHAKIINKINAENETVTFEKVLKELVGHTPLQVFFGGLLGIVIGILFPFILGNFI